MENKNFIIKIAPERDFIKVSLAQLCKLIKKDMVDKHSLIYHPRTEAWLELEETPFEELYKKYKGKAEGAIKEKRYRVKLEPSDDPEYMNTEQIKAAIDKGDFTGDSLIFQHEDGEWTQVRETKIRNFLPGEEPEEEQQPEVEEESQEATPQEGKEEKKDEESPEEEGKKEDENTIQERFNELSEQALLRPEDVDLALEFADVCIQVDDRFRAIETLKSSLEYNPYNNRLKNRLEEIAEPEELEDIDFLEKETPFYQDFKEQVLLYPFQGSLLVYTIPFILGLGMGLFITGSFLGFLLSGLASLALLAYAPPYFYKALNQTIKGKDTPPELDTSQWQAAIMASIRVGIGEFLYNIYFLPLSGIIALLNSISPILSIVPAFLLQMLFAIINPMIFILGMHEENLALLANPKIIIGGIKKMLKPYLVAVVLVYFILLAVTGVLVLGFLLVLQSPMGKIIFSILSAVAGFMTLIYAVRIYGLMYRQNKHQVKGML